MMTDFFWTIIQMDEGKNLEYNLRGRAEGRENKKSNRWHFGLPDKVAVVHAMQPGPAQLRGYGSVNMATAGASSIVPL